MSNDTAYKKLIEHQRGWLFALPEWDKLMPMLKMRFTPEEAEFCSKLPHLPYTTEELSGKLGMPIDEMTERLDALAKKGMIMRVEGRSATRYALMDTIFWFYRMPSWKGEKTEWDIEFSTLQNQYYIDVMANEFLGHNTQGLRAIPVNRTIQDPRQVLPYEDIMQVIDQVKYFTVSTCACRHRKKIDPESESCKHETLNCLHFDRLGQYIVQNGLGKEISKEETLEILASAADAGLVHGISNTQTGMDTICNCCSCCCLYLDSLAIMPRPVPRGHQRSNYILTYNKEKCIECGLCEKRCPMNAIELKKGEEHIIHADKCLGCGVCVHKCPKQAIELKKREKEIDTPTNLAHMSKRMLEERGFNALEVFKKNSL
ncbi:MAG: 4Fe-4S dicluster domain-containing protein [bacterium]|nr:4Fe-4S dicluster domain-containing protein [bacterium]